MFRFSPLFRMVIFTEQSPVLQQAAVSLKLKSNIWLEDWLLHPENFKWSPAFDLCAPQEINPTSVSLWKYFEVYNSDQLLNAQTREPVELEMDATQDTSYSSRRPYGRAISREMEDVRNANAYDSKWWISAGKTQGQSPSFAPRDPAERPHKFFIETKQQLYPLSLLKGSSVTRLLKRPISGATRRFMREGSTTGEALESAAHEREWTSNLFFTERQLDLAQMEVREGESPIEVSSAGSFGDSSLITSKTFNIEQLEGWENILTALGRYGTPTNSVYLFSGLEVRDERVLKEQPKYKQMYWISGRDAEQNNWAFKEGEENKGVFTGNEFTNKYFNVSQLKSPSEGFARAGLLEMRMP